MICLLFMRSLKRSFYVWSLRIMLILNRGVLLWTKSDFWKILIAIFYLWLGGIRDMKQRPCFNIHAEVTRIFSQLQVQWNMPTNWSMCSASSGIHTSPATVPSCAVRWAKLVHPWGSCMKLCYGRKCLNLWVGFSD